MLNPALSGIENYTDVKLGHRQQWLGLQDAPKTSFITANFALGDGNSWSNPLSLDGDEQDPRGWNYQQNYTASPAHHGLGFTAIVDKAAKLSTAAVNISYAYHLPLSGTTNLAVGIAAGGTQSNIDSSWSGFAIPTNTKPNLSCPITFPTTPTFFDLAGRHKIYPTLV